MTEASSKTDHRQNSGCCEEKIRHAQGWTERQSECDKLCPEDAAVFFFYLLTLLFPLLLLPHTPAGAAALPLSHPLPLYPLPLFILLRGSTAVQQQPF